MPIIRSSRVLYKWSLPVVFGALVFKLSVWCGAEGYVFGLRAAACVMYGYRRCALIFWYKDLMADLGIDGRIILQLFFKKWGKKSWTGFLLLWVETDHGRL